MNFRLKHTLAAMAMVGASVAFGAPQAGVAVKASLDSATLLMGYTTTLRLSVEQPSGQVVKFPKLEEAKGRPYFTLCGDTVEIASAYKTDTARISDSRIRVNYQLRVQAFDSGAYALPPFDYVAGNVRGKTNPLQLKVVPVKVKADDQISPFTPPLAPDEVKKVPLGERPAVKWLARWWWALLLAILLIGAGIWALKRYRKTGSILPQKPPVPPFDEAEESLRKLKERGLWQAGREKEYYTGLTFILRRYLSKEYGIAAQEMTSGQIMKALKADKDLKPLREPLRKLLDMADFVKFAKVRPLPEDNEDCFTITSDFINSAHKLHLEEIARQEAKAKAKAKAKSKNKK